MGQVTSSDIARNLAPGLKTIFMNGWKGVELPFKQIVTEVDSTLPTETYGWLGQLPAVREWTDERIPKGLSEYGYTIRNKKWEVSVKVDAETLEDEQYGQVKQRVAAMPGQVAKHQNQLVYTQLEAGSSTACYDGANFFSASHSEGNSGTQSNLLTTLPLTVANYATAKAAQSVFKDDQGILCGSTTTHLMVPPALEATARQILNADYVSDGTTTVSNIWKGSSQLIVNPFLTDTNDWYLLDLSAYVKPIIFQNRIPVTFKALDGSSDSDSVFMRDAFFYGVRARYNVGYGDWRTALRASN
jgi:phage major head subunit gpT-like protein